ncbi:alkyl sulfatase dimerization domain-containing protein [Saccharopolyspora sp. 5N102]|uniref:alkyl sulfatase dimerization domain-containing protein n=1 Tax=Saccharopolyspora sp. 5N102 TaxID=3375155 RepID=UPI00378A009D
MTRLQGANAQEAMRAVMGPLHDVWAEPAGRIIEVAPRTWSACAGVVNVGVIETGDGVVLVDTGMPRDGELLRALIRSVTDAPIRTVVYTHGHIDHAFGLPSLLDADEPTRAAGPPRIVAHRNVVRRFRRYARTAPLNASVNSRQSCGRGNPGRPGAWWPSRPDEFRWPDTLYDDRLTLLVGTDEIHLRHAKGETDDATWLWLPERKVLCAGDLWLSVFPNAGNPQKVQRYADDWIAAAEQMAALDAQAMIPGHGMPVFGEREIRTRWLDLAAALRHVVDHTVAGLNAGLPQHDIVADLKLPADLAAKPYLQPYHDRPEFVARNVIRLLGGWWDGQAANLLPAPLAEQTREIVRLAGGSHELVSRARELAADNLQLACHLAEWAVLGAPDDAETHRCVIELFQRRLEDETAFQARGIYQDRVSASRTALAELNDRS